MIRLNMNKLRHEKNFVTTSSDEALEDVTPINWSKEVFNGEKRVLVKTDKSQVKIMCKIGYLIEAFNNLIDYIENLKIDIEEITDNL